MVQYPWVKCCSPHEQKEEYNLWLSNRCRKSFWQNSTSIYNLKNSLQDCIEGIYLNIIKATLNRPTATIILNDEKLKTFSLKSGTREGRPLLLVLFNRVLESLAMAVRQDKEIKATKLERGKIVSICIWRFHQETVRTNEWI